MPQPVALNYFARPTLEVAPKLVGMILEANGAAGRIVEVEAYTDDAASHGARRTARSSLMHDTYGWVYVYLIYGRNYCVNFTTERGSVGAILIRALEPLSGLELMRERRGVEELRQLCSGPGKLCRALAIDLAANRTAIGERVKLYHGKARAPVIAGPRIGISKAMDLPWRFWEEDNPHVSR